MVAARLAGSIRQAGYLGDQVGEQTMDMEAIHNRRYQVVKGLRIGTEGLLSNHGVSLVQGRGRLVARDAVQVGDQRIHARSILVATGSIAAQLPLEGAELPGVLGTEEAVDLREVPPRMAILTGSPIDLELAQYFHLLGSHVTLIESGPRLLPEADREISQRVGKLFHDAGVAIWRGVAVEAIRRRKDGLLAVVLAESNDESSWMQS